MGGRSKAGNGIMRASKTFKNGNFVLTKAEFRFDSLADDSGRDMPPPQINPLRKWRSSPPPAPQNVASGGTCVCYCIYLYMLARVLGELELHPLRGGGVGLQQSLNDKTTCSSRNNSCGKSENMSFGKKKFGRTYNLVNPRIWTCDICIGATAAD